jgi:hypothetical protein
MKEGLTNKMDKVRVFISQPMSGLTDEDIIQNRDIAVQYLNENKHLIALKLIESENTKFSNIESIKISDIELEIIDNTQMNVPEKLPLQYLGVDIDLMAKADIVVFIGGWEKSRGCKVEFHIAEAYGYPCLFI